MPDTAPAPKKYDNQTWHPSYIIDVPLIMYMYVIFFGGI